MSSDEIAVERLENSELDPLEAFDRLRQYTPDRASFLLESYAPDAAAGRYSIVGYRVRGGYSVPPNVNAIEVAAEHEQEPRPASFAEALAQAAVGAIAFSVAHVALGVNLFGDEGPAGSFATGATVMLFDHLDGSILIAGPAKGNLLARLRHELAHGRATEPAARSAGEPESTTPEVADEKLKARVKRAQRFLGDELPEVVLARSSTAPLRGGDPFDAYRELRARIEAPFSYYLDFGKTPVSPSVQVFGMADEMLHLRRRDESEGLADNLGARLPHRRTLGAGPSADALKVVRKLEDSSRDLWGGAVGYLCPGGEAAFALADRLVQVTQGVARVTTGAAVNEQSDPEDVLAAIRSNAAPLLWALHTAQR